MFDDFGTEYQFFNRSVDMSCAISSDICSKIVIAINFIKKCSKQRPDKDKIAAILNPAYGQATGEILTF